MLTLGALLYKLFNKWRCFLANLKPGLHIPIGPKVRLLDQFETMNSIVMMCTFVVRAILTVIKDKYTHLDYQNLIV